MKLQQFSGIVISAGFILYVAAMLVAPQLYSTDDIAQRVAIIAASQSRWNVSQVFFALGPGFAAAGFLLLAVVQQDVPAGRLFWSGAILFAAGAGIAIWLVSRQTMDPVAFWEGTQTELIINYGFLSLSLAGMFFLGLALRQGGFPAWIAFLMAGSALILLIAMLVTRGQGGFFVSILVYLVTFIVGIAVWRG